MLGKFFANWEVNGCPERGEQDLSSEVGATVQDSTVGKQCLSHGCST